ncbi:MAG: lipopolysaccharide biosynthesis protein [Saprospiraceae bacterium]|nr:lipopolysaccharide biosynthesis protein [Saprospiraceae bacterium]
MGVIQRQSLKFTLINFVGTFIGFMSVIFIYPLNKDLYGYFQILHSNASLLVPILGLGIHGAIIKFYPIFKEWNIAKNFLSFTLVLASFSALIASGFIFISYYLAYPYLNNIFDNFEVIEKNKYVILILGIIFLYISIFTYHAVSLYRIVIPDIINNILLKVFLPVIVLLYYFQFIDKSRFNLIVIIYFLFIALILFKYLLGLSEHEWKPNIKKVDKAGYKGIFSFMAFSSLNSLGASLTFKLDVLMIGSMISTTAAGLYALILVISNIMDIPSKAINQIAGPVIAKNWVENDHNNIKDIYQKSSIYGAIIGVYLFLIIYFIWPEIIMLMPGSKIDLHVALLVFTFLGLAKLVDLTTGVNSIIISYSKNYKVHMYFLIMLAVINISLNYILLKAFGIAGAAIATCISILFYNIIKHLYVHFKFGFTLKIGQQLKVILIGCFVFVMMSFIPVLYMTILSMIIKCVLTTILYLALIWITNPGGEFKTVIKETIFNINQFLLLSIRNKP